MTCIVGLIDKGNVYIGGDSAGVGGYSMQIRGDRKVFKKDDFIFGFTSSFRMGQLIQYKFQIPKISVGQDEDEYLHGPFLDTLMACLEKNKYTKIDNNVAKGGAFIFGWKGKLYEIESDFQIAKTIYPFTAVGCGFDIALGCMYAIHINPDMSPEQKITLCLEASEVFSAGVRRPFHIVKLEK